MIILTYDSGLEAGRVAEYRAGVQDEMERQFDLGGNLTFKPIAETGKVEVHVIRAWKKENRPPQYGDFQGDNE
jgi:hypothetical protein